MGIFESIGNNSSSGGVVGACIRLFLRFFQFVLALTVCGLYAIDLHAGNQAGTPADGKWVYAVAIGGISAVTCLVYAIPMFKSYWAFGWDWILFVLWTAVFGLFGKIYIPAHPKASQDRQVRMKNAVWVDLACMLLWLVTAVYSTLIWFRGRNSRSLHTGRAKV